jgi:hypothetical protein
MGRGEHDARYVAEDLERGESDAHPKVGDRKKVDVTSFGRGPALSPRAKPDQDLLVTLTRPGHGRARFGP